MRVALLLMAMVLAGCDQYASVKTKVSALFRDPASSQFQALIVDPKSGATCGEVNSKNAYGAYAGYTQFYVQGENVVFRPERPFVPEFSSNARPDQYQDAIDKLRAYGEKLKYFCEICAAASFCEGAEAQKTN